MIKLNIHEIKTQFSKYIDMVEDGETVVVCKRNIPVAEIRAVESKTKRVPILGSAAGKTRVKKLLEPTATKDLRLWEEGDTNDPLRKYAPPSKNKRR